MLKPVFLRDRGLMDLNPMECGINSADPGDIYPWHYIKRHVLHYVTKGCGKYLVNGREFDVREGDLFVCHPGYHTCYIADEAEPFSYIWVGLECREVFARQLSRDVLRVPWAAPIFTRIMEVSEGAEAEWAVASCLFDFFARLAAQHAPSVIPREDYVSRAVTHIRANYAGPIRVEEMAATLGLSRHYFSRIFRDETGLSPQAYLVSYRLEKAAELLTKQSLSQKEAASQVGYPDVFTFSRMFKRKFGIPPGAYVRQYRLKSGAAKLPDPDAPLP